MAIPLCLGDSYESPSGRMFRVVGTTPDLFDKIQYGANADGTPKRYEFQPGGRNFKTENFFEAVVGSVVAAQSGLKVGDEINPTHGIGAEGHKHDGFKVVGILKPTGTANDRAVFINIEGFYLLEGHALSADEKKAAASKPANTPNTPTSTPHDHAHHEPLPIDQREVTSILVLCNSELGPDGARHGRQQGQGPHRPGRRAVARSDAAAGQHRRPDAAGAAGADGADRHRRGDQHPGEHLQLDERAEPRHRRDAGPGREPPGGDGDHPGGVDPAVAVGGVAGMLLGHALIGLASPYVEARTGVTLGLFEFDWQELVLIPALVVLASLVGFLPAVAAYRTDVAKALAGSR